jgi:phosphoenolpyruvate synthase/pyruvate phosphate dikinase
MRRVYIKELTRDYSLFRVVILDKSITEFLPSLLNVSKVYALYIYRRRNQLVDTYYEKGALEKSFLAVIPFIKEEMDVIREIQRFNKLFKKLEPIFKGLKSPTSIEELKELYEDYYVYWSLVAIIFYVPEFSETSDKLKRMSVEARYRTQEYADEIEKVFKRSLKAIAPHLKNKTRFILPEEVWSGEIFEDFIYKKIKDREKGFVFYDGQLYLGEEKKSLNKLNIQIQDSEEEIVLIKGNIAQKGIVSGEVKVVMSYKEISKVKEGDVLVAPMTMPTFLSGMRKAVAFVTDEGGLMCHAAIISREMKKPCIVGTKVATKLLKDGMKVEVNADLGIVNILR